MIAVLACSAGLAQAHPPVGDLDPLLLTGIGQSGMWGGHARSPSLLERYLWTPLSASVGRADGRTYLGNPTLDSETSFQLAASDVAVAQHIPGAGRFGYANLSWPF